MMKQLLGFAIVMTAFFGFSQEIEKIKTKNFVGTWYSKEKISAVKDKPVLTFYKNPPAGVKDSLCTTFQVFKEDIQVIRKDSVKTDTLNVGWFFIKESRNFKITQKVETDAKATTVIHTQYGTQTIQENLFITKTTTFHLESLTEEKMVLKYIPPVEK